MALNITSGIVPKAQKIVLYGPEGVGKTLFASKFPNPLFIDTEGSTEHYDVNRTEAPKSWTALLEQVREVRQTRPCSTLVIDTADWAEKLCIAHVCAENSWKSIEDPGYGKGYTPVVEEFGRLLNLLSDVVEAGMNVVLPCHAAIRKFDQPDESASYNRWALSLIDASKMSNSARTKEWADAVLFINYETIVETVGEGKQAKGKARGGQRRIMHCQHNACWDAKNRWGLADSVPFDYAQIAPFIPAGIHAAPAAAPVPLPTSAPAQTPAPVPPQATTAAPRPIQTLVYGQDGRLVSNTMHAPEPQTQMPDFWAPALQLMEQGQVTPDEIKRVAIERGHFTADTPLEKYPKEYVEGNIIALWPKYKEAVEKIRDLEVPFS